MGHPLEGWSKLNEGWDGGDIAVDELVDNAKTVVKNSVGPIMIAFAMIWALKVVVTLIVGVLAAMGVWVAKPLLTVANIISYLGIPVMVLVALAQNALYRPVQLQAFEGKAFISGTGEALSMARETGGKVILTAAMTGAFIGVGTVLCILPGIAALFFFCQAPYLAATTELPPWECMRRSYELNKKYALPVAIALAAALVLIGGFGGCGGSAAGFVGGLFGKLSVPVGNLMGSLGWDVMAILGAFGAFVSFAAVFTTIQSVERGVAFRRDEIA